MRWGIHDVADFAFSDKTWFHFLLLLSFRCTLYLLIVDWAIVKRQIKMSSSKERMHNDVLSCGCRPVIFLFLWLFLSIRFFLYIHTEGFIQGRVGHAKKIIHRQPTIRIRVILSDFIFPLDHPRIIQKKQLWLWKMEF